VAASEPIAIALLPAAGKAILGAAMVIGRLELLAILVLLAPDSWRN
jgi:trk system potassium uptake protein TrkH